MISRIERGESSPTAVVLGKLSGALEVSVSTLLHGDAGPDGSESVRRAAEAAEWRDPETGYVRRPVSSPHFPVDVTEVELPPGASVPYPARAFAFVTQLVWVLDGELTLVDGDERLVLRPGDTAELGPPRPREFANATSDACRYVVVVGRRATA